MSNLTTLKYNGFVSIKLKFKDKIINISNHNAGLPMLQHSFARLITGNSDGVQDLPEYLDVRVLDEQTEQYSTLLLTRLNLSGKRCVHEYVEELGTTNYVAKFDAIIPFNALKQQINAGDSRLFKLFLCSGAPSNTSGYYDLASMDIKVEELSKITPGTQAIIEWSMVLMVSNEDEV